VGADRIVARDEDARRDAERAAQVLEVTDRDDEALSLLVPGSGGIGSLRALLDRVDAGALVVSELSVQTPDLDDVFLTLTGSQDTAKVAPR